MPGEENPIEPGPDSGKGATEPESDRGQGASASSSSQCSPQKDVSGVKGGPKMARQFDFQTMFDSARATAMERSRAMLEARAKAEDDPPEAVHKVASSNVVISEQKDESDDDDIIGPAIPAALLEAHQSSQASTSGSAHFEEKVKAGAESDSDEEYVDAVKAVDDVMPTSCEVSFRHGAKAVSAIGLDSQGARFSTGGHDYNVKLYEFQTMDSALRPYREVQPLECHLITSLSYSCNSENLLVTAACSIAKLFDRKGSEWAETVKGDPYLHDAANTKGHTAAITGAVWHPFVKDQFLTCSSDGTMRIWSTQDWKEVTKLINNQRSVIKVKSAQGKRAGPTSCSYSRDGKLVSCATNEGSVLFWRTGRVYVTPTLQIRKAHNGPITGLCLIDDTLKLWDLRQLKTPVHVKTGLDNSYDGTNCCFSASNDLCVTGTTPRKNETGRLVVLSKTTFESVYEISYPNQGALCVNWHPKINQIFVGLTDGDVRCYYDPKLSTRGASVCVGKPTKRNKKTDVVKEELIIAPLSLPLFNPKYEDQEEAEVAGWRLKRLLRMQSKTEGLKQQRKPAETPLPGSSIGGRMQEPGAGSYHSYVLRQFGVAKNKSLREDTDVRASILKHADAATKESLFFGNVYKANQPEPVFQDKTVEEPVVDELEPVFKKSRVIE